MAPDPAKAARELLAFYLEAGADAFLGEEPVNRLAEPEPQPSAARPAVRDAGQPRVFYQEAAPTKAPRTLQRTPPRPAVPAAGAGLEGQAAPAAPEAAIMDARAQARSAATLEELRKILAGFEGCELK